MSEGSCNPNKRAKTEAEGREWRYLAVRGSMRTRGRSGRGKSLPISLNFSLAYFICPSSLLVFVPHVFRHSVPLTCPSIPLHGSYLLPILNSPLFSCVYSDLASVTLPSPPRVFPQTPPRFRSASRAIRAGAELELRCLYRDAA